MKPSTKSFPSFDLARLLKTVFDPKKGEKLCILIDLEDPSVILDFAFLKYPNLDVQKKAYEVIYQGLRNGVMQKFQLGACDFFAYRMTGGSNLELPDIVYAPDGSRYQLEKDIYPQYQIIMCIGSFSATAPLTAAAKKYGFRGATMHGMNDIILKTGLAVDYDEISHLTEILRQGMTHADWVEIDFEVSQQDYHLHVELGQQEAQKSHGICRKAPDIANLPAGEVYFVPVDAFGSFPVKFEEDGTIGVMQVRQGKVDRITLLKGNQETIKKIQTKFEADPAAARLGELGFGTQTLPPSGADIQDEKIFGTFHLATGRNDHLNGDITKDSFRFLQNATHDDILFSPHKTPEIHVKQVRMKRHGKIETLIENDAPAPYLLKLAFSGISA